MSKTYVFWDESSFGVSEGCEDASLPDDVIQIACESTPAMIKIAVERCFLGVEFENATPQVRADALVLNAIFWVMHQTGFDDYKGIVKTYKMKEQYVEGFEEMAMGTETSIEQDFNTEEWETRYQES